MKWSKTDLSKVTKIQTTLMTNHGKKKTPPLARDSTATHIDLASLSLAGKSISRECVDTIAHWWVVSYPRTDIRTGIYLYDGNI